MSDLKHARALLDAAERDYSALRGMRDPAVFADEIFGFHAEQAVEKLLKALLALLGQTYPATHDLARLVDMLKAHDVEAARFDELVEYNPLCRSISLWCQRSWRDATRPKHGCPTRGSAAGRGSAAAGRYRAVMKGRYLIEKLKGCQFSPPR